MAVSSSKCNPHAAKQNSSNVWRMKISNGSRKQGSCSQTKLKQLRANANQPHFKQVASRVMLYLYTLFQNGGQSIILLFACF